jgi:hypothetical protein
MNPMHPPQPAGQAGPLPPATPVGYTLPTQRPPLDQPDDAPIAVTESVEENGPASGLLPMRQQFATSAQDAERDESTPDDAEAAAEPEPEAVPETVAEAVDAPAAEVEVEPETEAEAEVDADTAAKAEAKPEAEAIPETVAEAVDAPAAEVQGEPEPAEPVAEAGPEPETVTVPETVAEAVDAPAAETGLPLEDEAPYYPPTDEGLAPITDEPDSDLLAAAAPAPTDLADADRADAEAVSLAEPAPGDISADEPVFIAPDDAATEKPTDDGELLAVAGADDLTEAAELEAEEAEAAGEAEEEPVAAEAGVLVGATAALRPGDVAEMPIAVWHETAAQQFRVEWQVVAARFVDEPDAALSQAQALVTSAVQTLAERLLAEQVDLDPRRETARPDTEAMRVAMRRYRDFLDRVLAL